MINGYGVRTLSLMSLLGLTLCFVPARNANAQVDQGAITGSVEDSTGAVIPNANIKLTNIDTGLVLQTKTDNGGMYVFSPLKIGHYTVSASAAGFATTLQEGLQVDIQARLKIVLVLKPAGATTEVTVSTAPPLLQTEQGSVGQVVSTQTINNLPLNGRNWVFIAQLTAGTAPSINGLSRGAASGDFYANGQRATQNNFILDGVDNNVNVIDFMNGASYNVRPPPDALAEFKVETSDFSAEFGHSAGAVLNASTKSGTNQIHGSGWEFARNTVLDARNWNAATVTIYQENQFGATLGLPILRNKLFYFGDVEANRITLGSIYTFTVPTALMRQGNFTELQNTALTGAAKAYTLYQPNSGGTQLMVCNGQQNVMCPGQIDSVAQNILNLYPKPNTNGGKTTNNYTTAENNTSNTWQWDQRLDWNISPKDQVYARFSYLHVQSASPSPIGPVLDGVVWSGQENVADLSENGMGSETHIFNPNLVNEFRFSYNWGGFLNLQENANTNVASTLGLGGVPFGPGSPFNGGLPNLNPAGISTVGTGYSVPSIEHQNVYQILDNVTKIAGKHSLRFGISLQSVRQAFLQPNNSRGVYTWTGLYTSNLGASFTGYGVADFLANQMNSSSISGEANVADTRWYHAGYVQDDWKILRKLTLNLGVRYDYYQPWKEQSDLQANFIPLSLGVGTGSGILQFPNQVKSTALAPAFTALLAANNIALQYVSNERLVNGQKANFAPRIGFAYTVTPTTVIRGGFGIFYGGFESFGSANLGNSYPFVVSAAVSAPSCTALSCPSISSLGVTLEKGMGTQLATGLQNFISFPSLNSIDPNFKTAYSEGYNLTVERALPKGVIATASYVGDVSRHFITSVGAGPNSPAALLNPANSTRSVQPFLGFGSDSLEDYAAYGTYNGLQAKLQKRYSNGLDFMANYTWSHSLDNGVTGLSQNPQKYIRNYLLIPLRDEYTNSGWDTRHRITFSGLYDLPFGKGRRFVNQGGMLNMLAGGWTSSIIWVAQTGNPFVVTPNISTAAGGGVTRTFVVRNPFTPGGNPDASNPGITCAASTRNRTNWYNPCAFANPLPGSSIPASGPGSQITGEAAAISYLGGKTDTVYGPGYERVNMSLFKNFPVWREQYVVFRADVFNLLNHPTFGYPSVITDNTNGGQITGPASLGANTPDARFFQLSVKYEF
jgi:hypothetical protein